MSTDRNQKINLITKGRRHGLLSMLAMIVGTVVGSGIFIKNEQLWDMTNGSALESIIGWFIAALLVVFVLVAFLEIASITTHKKEQGTMSNWSRHLWGEKVSKFIGFFFPIVYFPVLVAGLSIFSADYFVRGLETSFGQFVISGMNDKIVNWLIVSIVALLAIILIYIINSFTTSGTKFLQLSGTFLKLIPLFSIIIIGIVIAIYPSVSSAPSQSIEDIFDPNSSLNVGFGGGLDSFNVILLLLPTIMFSFDGFLYAASLSNESKKVSTFKSAAMIGITFIVIIYVLVTIFTFMLGDPTKEGGMTITSALQTAFPSQEWIAPTVTFLIFISIITSVSGSSVFTQKTLSDLSYQRYIVDKNGSLIKRNASGATPNAGAFSMLLTIIIFIILRAMDGTLLYVSINESVSISQFQITGWATDMIIVFSFSIYAFIIIGGIKNRFTYNVYTKKSKFFLPSAVIAVPMIFLILGYFVQDVFYFSFDNYTHKLTSLFEIVFLIIFILMWLLFLSFSQYHVKNVKLTPTEEITRRIYNWAYANVLTINEAYKIIKAKPPKELGKIPNDFKLKIKHDKKIDLYKRLTKKNKKEKSKKSSTK